eukprot:scaffold35109_cov90-Isochrysis_galbana.AAC.1
MRLTLPHNHTPKPTLPWPSHLVDELDPMLAQHGLDVELLCRLDVAQHDGLGGCQKKVHSVVVNQGAQARLEAQGRSVRDAAALNVNAQHQLAVALGKRLREGRR